MTLRGAALVVTGMLLAAPLQAQQWDLRIAMDDKAYAAAQSEQQERGMYVVDQAIYDAGDGTPRYAALWRDDVVNVPVIRAGLDVDRFYRASIAVVDQSYRMIDITVGVVGGAALYGGRWLRPYDRGHGSRYRQSQRELRRALRSGNTRITSIAPFLVDGRLQLASSFEEFRDGTTVGLVDAKEAKLRRIDKKNRANGYELMQLRAWTKGKSLRYVALWHKAEKPEARVSPLLIARARVSTLMQVEQRFRSQGIVPQGFSILPGETPAISVWAISR